MSSLRVSHAGPLPDRWGLDHIELNPPTVDTRACSDLPASWEIKKLAPVIKRPPKRTQPPMPDLDTLVRVIPDQRRTFASCCPWRKMEVGDGFYIAEKDPIQRNRLACSINSKAVNEKRNGYGEYSKHIYDELHIVVMRIQ